MIPGGPQNGAPSMVRRDIRAQAIAKPFSESDKPISSICHGPWLLASAGPVDGRRLTSFRHDGVPEDIKKAGGVYARANAKLTSLSTLAELANVSLTPPTDFPSGIQIVKLTKLDWNYQKITESISQDEGTSLIVFYVPVDGSVIHLELTNSPYNGYEFEPTAQRGIAWRNETWVKIGTVKSVFNVTRPDDSEFVWESPVVWSLKTMGNGVFESSPLGRGWYTFNLFGAFTFLQSGYIIGQPSFGNRYQFSGDSFRADATFRLLSGGKSIFFAVARPRDNPWGTIQ